MNGSKIKLRAITRNDIERTLEWHNQEDIKDLYLGHPFPVNKETEELWYNRILTSNIPTTVFGIEFIPENKLIGLTFLKDINFIHRSAEFAIYIGDLIYRGKGYSTAASTYTLAFAFNQLGLNRVYLKVLERNSIALELYKKIGFSVEGKLRESIFKNGYFENEILMSILRSEFNHKYYAK